jgi:signal transduction histidine kinase
MSSKPIRDLTHAALDAEGPGTIGDLVGVVARATGSSGAVLWEAPDERHGDSTLSVLAFWCGGTPSPSTERSIAADPVTELAHRTRSLAIPADAGFSRVYGYPVAAALPIDYVDSGRGVVTLLGDTEFLESAFDTAVQLVDVLPELSNVVRERQTLALVNACNRIQRRADLESPDWPLSRQRLATHLTAMCELVSDWLHCPEVSAFLFDPASGDRGSSLFAGTAGSDSTRPKINETADVVRSGAGVNGEPLMEVRLLRGERIAGLIRCRGTNGPPHHFTASDMALLRPIAAQVSNYWGSWLNRWAIANENDSWRRLAAGMTLFNKLLAEGLHSRDDERHEQQMSDMAVAIVDTVVAESSGAVVLRVEESNNGAPVLRAIARTGREYRRAPASMSGSMAETVRINRQHSITNPQELTAEGISAGHGWLLRTPIRVGRRLYGVLEAAGPGHEPPANSEQVHEIVGDQIGLYRQLGDMQRSLELARISEAAAMEDLKHQLVSPLRTATDRTERLLSCDRFESGMERQLKAIRGLCRKASRVAMSAGVFATLSRGGKPEPKPERMGADDLVRMLIAAADDAQVLGNPRRGITFQVERDSARSLGRRLVDVDASFLQQCVGNLLDNAAKYAYPDTRVEIRLETTTSHLSVAVGSTGLPLSPRDVTRCIQRNWRGDVARTTTGEGSGIGLWIVDNLMAAMGGRLVVEPFEDRTTVRLKLPLV